jgi:hypothetical protein
LSSIVAEALSPQQIEALSKMLLSAFKQPALNDLIFYATGDRLLVDYGDPNLPYGKQMRLIVEHLEETGTRCLVLAKAKKERPNRQDFLDFVDLLCPTPPPVGGEAPTPAISIQRAGAAPPGEVPPSAAAPGFERNIRKHIKDFDAVKWLRQMQGVTERVCRIEIDGQAAGTGFLVGPEAVLTNYHVTEGFDAQRIACRFDYYETEDGVSNGTVTPLHADGIVDSSPYSPAEAQAHANGPPPATNDELDYALLRLSVPRGEEMLGARRRKWLALPDTMPPLPKGAPILIMQHPKGAPMKLALDTDAVLEAPAGLNARIRYATNTEEGSSGSPVFTLTWSLAALHHYGDPDWSREPEFNQGVPIDLIKRRIKARDKGKFLGE